MMLCTARLGVRSKFPIACLFTFLYTKIAAIKLRLRYMILLTELRERYSGGSRIWGKGWRKLL